MKKYILRKLLKLMGYDYPIILYNRFQNRYDTMNSIDFLLSNHRQNQTIKITTKYGESLYCQIGHYDINSCN